MNLSTARRAAAFAAWLVFLPGVACAYIGPGAGVALLSSFFVLLTTLLVAVLTLLIWPFRTLWRLVTRKRPPAALVRRLVIVGFDGQDPQLTDRFLSEGKLPNFERLARLGGYRRLATTYPALSPVAWSSFATGTNPGKHNIFDFLGRDPRTYLPTLSSASIGAVDRFLRLGRFRIPLARPELRLLRRSKPFWTLLGEHRIWSTVLRVPITFPPERFYGAQLSAMSTPDLLGTQGTFLLFSTRPAAGAFKEGGLRRGLERRADGSCHGTIEGPGNTFVVGEPPLGTPLVLVPRPDHQGACLHACLHLGADRHQLELGKLTDWIPIVWKAAPGVRVHGLARLVLLELGEHVSLYVSPINLSPERPAMPISHPGYYATYLAKLQGNFSTLGLAEDTWALNEKVTDDATFLQQTYDIDRERETMLFSALERTRRGSVVCVFDATDRIQHMFWRYLEPGHPAAPAGATDSPHAGAIEQLYRHNDALVGRLLDRLVDGDLLFVLADHGFGSFRRGVNLNRWLLERGYLALREGADGSAEWLRDVDWSRTRAYVVGLSGMYLNLRGREAQGIVEPGEQERALKRELMAGLAGLRDAACEQVGVNEAFDTAVIYQGPYRQHAPDLIIGYNRGYRVSWDCATGMISGPVFEDNTKAWSGDHCFDPRLVPGVLFSSRPIDRESPSILDLAPTALLLFGIEPPPHMEGQPLFDFAGFGRVPAAGAKAA